MIIVGDHPSWMSTDPRCLLGARIRPKYEEPTMAARDDTAFSLTWQPFSAQAVNKYRIGSSSAVSLWATIDKLSWAIYKLLSCRKATMNYMTWKSCKLYGWINYELTYLQPPFSVSVQIVVNQLSVVTHLEK
jgi:hypothetical protein